LKLFILNKTVLYIKSSMA